MILFWERTATSFASSGSSAAGFQLPVADEKRVKVEMEAAQLAMLLDGIDLNAKRLERWNPHAGIDTDPGS
jgi:hypothetical protein